MAPDGRENLPRPHGFAFTTPSPIPTVHAPVRPTVLRGPLQRRRASMPRTLLEVTLCTCPPSSQAPLTRKRERRVANLELSAAEPIRMKIEESSKMSARLASGKMERSMEAPHGGCVRRRHGTGMRSMSEAR